MTELTDTKEKILFSTNELVMSLNTQVAVLNNTLMGLVDKLDEFIKLENERNEKVDTRLIINQTDIATLRIKIESLEKYVNYLQVRNVWWDAAGIVGAIIAAVIAWFK